MTTAPTPAAVPVPTPDVGELAASTALVWVGRRRGGFVGGLIAAAGLALGARVLAPLARRALLAVGDRRRRAELRTVIRLDRPLREVFAFCADFENFVSIFRFVNEIVDYRDGRSRWVVETSAGRTLTWDAVTTKYVPNVVIAWRSVAGSAVDATGVLRFAPLGGGGTEVRVELCFEPRETDMAEALHALFRRGARRRLGRDLEALPDVLDRQPQHVSCDATPAQRPEERNGAGNAWAAAGSSGEQREAEA